MINRRTFVIGDIHGDYEGVLHVLGEMFNEGMDLRRDLLVQVGDLVDGFPYSKQVVNLFRCFQKRLPENVVVLKGNHEELMIKGSQQHKRDDAFQLWWQQGGKETWESYWDGDGTDVLQMAPYLNLPDVMYRDMQWIDTLPTMHETNDFYFVHAGFPPNSNPHHTWDGTRMWIRGDFLRTDYMWDKIVVHGHSPVKEPEVKPNRINVNTRPRGKGYVTGAELFSDGRPPKFYKPPQHVIDMVNDNYKKK